MTKQKRKNDEQTNFSSEFAGCFEVALVRFIASVLVLVCVFVIVVLFWFQPFSSFDTLFMVTIAGTGGLSFGYLALYYGDTSSQKSDKQ